MTIEETAQYLKVSKETLYKMVQQNQFPGSKLGNQWRFNRDTVDTWLQAKSNFSLTKNNRGKGVILFLRKAEPSMFYGRRFLASHFQKAYFAHDKK